MRTPVNQRTLKQHLAYGWWKYLLAGLLAFFLVDLLYTFTAYRTPEEKKIEVYVYGQADADRLTAYLDSVHQAEMADMEEVTHVELLDDSYYGPMQLTTYMAAGEGDVYILPRDPFVSGASSGAFLPLEEDSELMALFDAAGINLQNGWRRNADTGESHLCGIPLSKLPGLNEYVYAENGYISLLINGGNTENAKKFLRILCRDMMTTSQPAQQTALPPAASPDR